MQKILAVVGPTASGKTALAISLAKRYNGEILSCDSMQIYRGMDIGTAKPSEQERGGIVHHLFDIAFVTDSFSCADYQKYARQAVAQITDRGKLPIFCGGTGLYLDSALYDRPFDRIPTDPALRARFEKMDAEQLYQTLLEIDPESAKKTHCNNKKRVIRALEIYSLTHKTKTQWDGESLSSPPLYDATILGIDFLDRACLYERIDLRVKQMVQAGLEQEVRSLPLSCASTAAQAIGYREFLDFFAGRGTLEEVVAKIAQNSRNYAKRQLTWFRAKPVLWLMRDGKESEEELCEKAVALLEQHGWEATK